MELEEYPRPPADTGWGFHDSASVWCKPEDVPGYARYLHQELGITWFKALVSGTNKLDLVRAFTEQGIEVVVRFYAYRPHPHFVVFPADVRAYVQAGAHYFEWGNEPNLLDEWDEASWREGAQPDKVCEQWLRNADAIRQGGGIPLLPALSPGGHYPHRQFYRTMLEWLRLHNALGSLDGAAVAIHNRPLNHPLDYQDDSGCHFLDYEWIDDLMQQYLGRSLPLLATEAGYEPGWAQDPRYPDIDLERHAAGNVEILRGFRVGKWRDCLFCQCMWLVAPFGDPGHGFDNAHWHDNRAYGGNLPAVERLKEDWAAYPFVRRFSWEGLKVSKGPDPNVPYWHSERGAYVPQWIIIHDTEGSANAALNWWKSDSNPYQSSAHYLVRSDGTVEACVPERYAAHHVGGSYIPGFNALNPQTGHYEPNANLVTIGVELEYPAPPASPPWPVTQVRAAILHVRELCRVYGIPRDGRHILRHGDIDPAWRSDPRNLDWSWFLAQVAGEGPVGLSTGWPHDEPAAEPGLLQDKIRWWTEQAVREVEGGFAERGHAILLDLVDRERGLMYRLERLLKAG